MEELENWELEELRSPDCDGAYWMIMRGRKQQLEKLFELNDESLSNES